MSQKGMNRRQFLQTSGTAVAGGAAAIGAGAVLIGPDGAWALGTKAFDEHTALTLLGVCREMYPHDRLGDEYYARLVEGLDAKAAGDPGLAKLLGDGVAGLDGANGGVTWVALGDGDKLAALKQIESTTFFQTVRGHVVTTLYNDPEVWRQFGYEGSSWEYGGYLERGFNDIAWLKDA